MLDIQIVRALIDVAILFEFSGEDAIDGDASIAALEQLAATLQRVEGSRCAELVAAIRSLAVDYGPRESFVRSLPDLFGIA